MEQEFGVTIHARTEIVQIIGKKKPASRFVKSSRLFGPRQSWHDHWNAGCGDRHYHGEMVNWISSSLSEEEIIKDSYGKPIRVKTLGQKIYVDSVKNHDVTFGIGPAGTGENLPSSDFGRDCPQGVRSSGLFWRVQLWEAGESLGFFQRSQRKSGPLSTTGLMLYQILGKTNNRMMEREIIEIAPWLICGGGPWRCLVILDEAQTDHHHADEDVFDPSWFNSERLSMRY